MPRARPKQQVLLLLSLESTCHFLLRFSFSLALSLSLLLFSVLSSSSSSLFFLLAEGKVGCFCFACTKAFETILLLIDEKTFKNIRRRRAACCCCCSWRRRQLCFPVRTYACVVPLVLTLFFNPRERERELDWQENSRRAVFPVRRRRRRVRARMLLFRPWKRQTNTNELRANISRLTIEITLSLSTPTRENNVKARR